MEDYELKQMALEWLNSLKGTRFEIKGNLTEKELIQIGKNRLTLKQ